MTITKSAPVQQRAAGKYIPRSALLTALCLAVGVLIIGSLFTGEYDISISGIFSNAAEREMFFISRVPRTLALVFAAIAMSLSGVIMQMITQNKFVEPTTAGTTQWSGLGLLFVFIVLPGASPTVRMIIASVFAFIGTMIFLAVLRKVAVTSAIVVPLVGIMLGAVVGAITTFLAGQFNLLQSMSTWRSGGFSSIVRGFYEPLWAVLIIAILTFVMADRFTVAGLGKNLATTIGVNYERVVLVGTTMVALATGVTTAVVGFIPFLGLVVPNAISLVLGDNTRRNLPWVALSGAGLLLVCDLIGRIVVAPMEIPASVILGAIGAVMFIALVLRQRNVSS